MKKTIAALLLVAFAAPALAQKVPPPPPPAPVPAPPPTNCGPVKVCR